MADTDKRDVRILYVDDDEPNLHSFHLILDEEYDIVTALKPDEALELVDSDPRIGVAIVDWKLKANMNGTELIHEIKRRRPEIVCIMFTAYISFELARASVNDPDIFRYLEKPMEYAGEEFLSVLNAAISEHQKLRSSMGTEH